MRYSLIEIGLPLFVVIVGALAFGRWLADGRRALTATPRVPIAQAQDSGPRPEDVIPPTTTPTPVPATAVTPPTTPPDDTTPAIPVSGAWPRFRGAYSDGISYDRTPLATRWTADGPPRLWTAPLGEGYAGPAVLNGRVYLLDYDASAKQDVLRCFALHDGRELWRSGYASPTGKQHGYSRTVPAVTEHYVVTLGPRCIVSCADAATGKQRWMHDLVAEYGTAVPEWNAGQCPLIEDGRAIIAPGGSALLVAFDCATGEEIWRTPNPDGWKMTHSSILPLTWKGRRLYVYCASGGVVGVDAADGRVLWKTADWVVRTANIPTPVSLGDGRLFLSGGCGAGSKMIRLVDKEGDIAVEELFHKREAEFGAYQQTPIYYNGHIYSVIPNGQLACMSPDGEIRWKSGTAHRYAWNAYTLAGGMLYLLNDRGELSLVTATPRGFSLRGKAKVLDGTELWGPIAIAGRRLLARDLTTMVCLDIGAQP